MLCVALTFLCYILYVISIVPNFLIDCIVDHSAYAFLSRQPLSNPPLGAGLLLGPRMVTWTPTPPGPGREPLGNLGPAPITTEAE
jgi:hypothetical protein